MNFKIKAFEDLVFAVGHVDAIELEGSLASALGLRELKAERLARCVRLFEHFHLLQKLEFALHLRRLGGDLAETVGEILDRGDFLLLILEGGGLLDEFRLFLALVV